MNITEPKLFKRGKKLWIRFSVNGKYVRKSLNLDDNRFNRNLAKTNIIPQIILKIHSGEFFKKDNVPILNDYKIISFQSHMHERKPMTNKAYEGIYNKHIKPYFGKERIDKIKVSDINIWKNRLYSEFKLSSRRVNDIKKIFGTILEDAVRDEVLLSNPVSKSRPLPVHQEKEIEPFSIEEIQRILEVAQEQDKNLIATLFMTGMRTGELIGLKWSDINFERKEISIKRTIGKGIEGTPKTVSSYRTIPILKSLYPYLKNQFELTGKKDSYVFLNDEERHFFDSKNIRAGLWKRVLEKSSVKYRTIYHTRHSFCSINLQHGEDIIWVSKVLGHKNPRVTLEKYSKHIKSSTEKETIFDMVL